MLAQGLNIINASNTRKIDCDMRRSLAVPAEAASGGWGVGVWFISGLMRRSVRKKVREVWRRAPKRDRMVF
jgi:hypothetical protein